MEKLDINMKKNAIEHLSHTAHQKLTKYRWWLNVSLYCKDLNVRPEIIKLLVENVEGKLLDISVGNDFFNMTPTMQATEIKISKRDFMK